MITQLKNQRTKTERKISIQRKENQKKIEAIKYQQQRMETHLKNKIKSLESQNAAVLSLSNRVAYNIKMYHFQITCFLHF